MIHQPKKKRKSSSILLTVLIPVLICLSGCNHHEPIPPVKKPPEAQKHVTSAPASILDSTNVHPPGTSGMGKRTVIAIHGLGDTPEQFSFLFKEKSVPAEVILPRAPTPHAHGGSWFPVAIPARSTPPAKLKSDVIAATNLLCRFIENGKFKRKPVITGFSQGGILSFSIAVTCPEKIHAAVPVAGFLPLDLPKNTRIPPIIAFHGTADKILDFQMGKESIKKLYEAKVDAKLYQFPDVGHTISEEMHQRWFDILNDLVK